MDGICRYFMIMWECNKIITSCDALPLVEEWMPNATINPWLPLLVPSVTFTRRKFYAMHKTLARALPACFLAAYSSLLVAIHSSNGIWPGWLGQYHRPWNWVCPVSTKGFLVTNWINRCGWHLQDFLWWQIWHWNFVCRVGGGWPKLAAAAASCCHFLWRHSIVLNIVSKYKQNKLTNKYTVLKQHMRCRFCCWWWWCCGPANTYNSAYHNALISKPVCNT